MPNAAERRRIEELQDELDFVLQDGEIEREEVDRIAQEIIRLQNLPDDEQPHPIPPSGGYAWERMVWERPDSNIVSTFTFEDLNFNGNTSSQSTRRGRISSEKNNSRIMKQIVSFENNEIKENKDIDYFFPEVTNLPVTFYNDQFYCFESVEKALEFGFIEDKKTMSWFKPEFNSPAKIVDKNWYTVFTRAFMQPKSKTYLLTEGKQYTFGVEFECSKLYLPEYVYINFNALCIRDGSLNAGAGGPEIVTGVLNGDEGLDHLQLICSELTARGEVDRFCGMHLHLGGMDFSKENLVYLYKICLYLEEQIMELVPKGRRNNEYCRRLDKLELTSDINNQSPYEYKMNLATDLDLIFEYIKYIGSSAITTKLITRKDQHPLGPKCKYDHKTPRYCWVNFVPAVFNTRNREEAKTIEIRLAPGTTMYVKTKNWLLLWMGILWFVENKKNEIREGLTLETILLAAYPKRGGKLINYWNSRKELFKMKDGEISDNVQEVESIKSIKDQI